MASVEDRLTKALADGFKINGSVVMALMMEAAKPAAESLRQIKEELRDFEDFQKQKAVWRAAEAAEAAACAASEKIAPEDEEYEVEVEEFEHKGKTYWRELKAGFNGQYRVLGGDEEDPEVVGECQITGRDMNLQFYPSWLRKLGVKEVVWVGTDWM